MTDSDNTMHLQHFGTDPTDIQIWINPKIRIQIPDNFWLKFWRWRRFALSECSCYYCCCCWWWCWCYSFSFDWHLQKTSAFV